MRISWLEPDTAERIRSVLLAWKGDWSGHFTPDFQIPPPPPGMTGKAWQGGRWARAAEHVARTQRVRTAVQSSGLAGAVTRYEHSEHAVEIAALIAQHSDRIPTELVFSLLRCDIDELLVYGPFLQLLEQIGVADENGPELALSVYTEFCANLVARTSDELMWSERVRAARDGLAGFCVRCGRLERGHALFLKRHGEDRDGILVALAASRAFLTVGALNHTVTWLGLGAERADTLGRAKTADKLRQKRDRISARM